MLGLLVLVRWRRNLHSHENGISHFINHRRDVPIEAPNPSGAPGKFALTEVKANKAPTGTTNISAKIS